MCARFVREKARGGERKAPLLAAALPALTTKRCWHHPAAATMRLALGDSGSNACPAGREPLTRDECKEAAPQLSMGTPRGSMHSWFRSCERKRSPIACSKSQTTPGVFYMVFGRGGLTASRAPVPTPPPHPQAHCRDWPGTGSGRRMPTRAAASSLRVGCSSTLSLARRARGEGWCARRPRPRPAHDHGQKISGK